MHEQTFKRQSLNVSGWSTAAMKRNIANDRFLLIFSDSRQAAYPLIRLSAH
ncbi:hypothetical protein ANI02nite_36330 [Acetobacter nitrogenifigens DSM 23921 = NBRC 105050]|uniref:Uncharacterized protein n=1 Tax=Acetobacter nitrogenifigens DSM 23921 = NBRC 105050 TaxID=1120919 RepID=A0A511XFN2_9PROT|nr:hypothetical protein ANI02nite_36330 [Acetobacter nitrogenifigens DSM 23921 = NBRC 105050]